MVLGSLFWHHISLVSCIADFFLCYFLLWFSENLSLTVVKKKGGSLISESKRHRIMHERSLDDDITEMLVHEDWENQLILIDNDFDVTKRDRDDVTDIHDVVIPPDSSLLFRPLHLPSIQNVGISVIVPSCKDIVDLHFTPFVSIWLSKLTSMQVEP